jgi:integrase
MARDDNLFIRNSSRRCKRIYPLRATPLVRAICTRPPALGFLSVQTAEREQTCSTLKTASGPLRFHDLRHTCATMLIAQGIHPRTVMEVLGHSQISVTMNTYGHVQPEVMRAASDAMDRLFTLKPNGAPPPETDSAAFSEQPEDASAKK